MTINETTFISNNFDAIVNCVRFFLEKQNADNEINKKFYIQVDQNFRELGEPDILTDHYNFVRSLSLLVF